MPHRTQRGRSRMPGGFLVSAAAGPALSHPGRHTALLSAVAVAVFLGAIVIIHRCRRPRADREWRRALGWSGRRAVRRALRQDRRATRRSREG